MVFPQTTGRRLPHITGLRVNFVTLGWDGAPNERALLKVNESLFLPIDV